MGKGIIACTVALSAAFFALALHFDDYTTSANIQQASVSIGDNFFAPRSITVVPGTTIVWRNDGQALHTVTSDTEVFNSGSAEPQWLRAGQTFAVTLTAPGTYPYYCILHGAPGGVGQAGTVIVQAAQPTAPPIVTPPGVQQTPVGTAPPRTAGPSQVIAPAVGPVTGVGPQDGAGSSDLSWPFIGAGVVLLALAAGIGIGARRNH